MSQPKFRDPTMLSRIVVVLLGAQALAFLWVTVSIAIRTWIAEVELLWDVEQALGSQLQIAHWITAAAFLFWFHRAHQNLAALGATPQHSSGFAVGCWFIPLANLWMPCQVASDIWRCSLGAPSDDPEAAPRDAGGALIVWWWVLFLVRGFAVQGSEIMFRSLESYATVNTVAIVADGLALAAAVLAILVVVRITRRQVSTASGPAPTVF